jgi:hypothetical protein
MIRVTVNEVFPVTVSLVDETTGQVATGQDVYYDIRRQPNDAVLSPPVAGSLTESTIEPGIYNALESINQEGTYVVYATCSGFLPNTEEIIVAPNYNRHYNTAVEDVIRSSATPTASQAARKVGLGKTDYVITRIKPDHAADWTDPATVSGVVYAHYRELDDDVPFKMGGPGV